MFRLTNYQKSLIIVVLSSLALRWFLVLSGGQYFFPDEGRYNKAIVAVRNIMDGEYTEAIHRLHDYSHYLFGYIALVPAVIQETLFPVPQTPALFFHFSQ